MLDLGEGRINLGDDRRLDGRGRCLHVLAVVVEPLNELFGSLADFLG
jgi:hypothetical protein